MRECNEYEITVEKLLNVVHRYTEKIVIYVVSDSEMIQDRVHEFYITRNFSESQEEIDRVLKYYGDVPVWNLTVECEGEYVHGMKGKHIVGYIKAHCYYRDAREGFLREKEGLCKERRKERRKEYRRRRKEGEKNAVD